MASDEGDPSDATGVDSSRVSTETLPAIESEHALEEELVASMRRDGHVVVRGLASRAEVEAYRPEISAAVQEVARAGDRQGRIDDYSKLFIQVTNVWRTSKTARRIVFAKRFAGVAARLLETPSVRLYHDQALLKPPRSPRTPWHRDRDYWPLETDLTITMWLALVDVDESMGPMVFASGSHRWAGLGDLAISEEADRRIAAMTAEQRCPLATTPLRAGDATFHLGGTLHSAGANLSDVPREVLTVIYYPAGTRASVPANENQRVDGEVFLPGIRPGEEAASALNPILYP